MHARRPAGSPRNGSARAVGADRVRRVSGGVAHEDRRTDGGLLGAEAGAELADAAPDLRDPESLVVGARATHDPEVVVGGLEVTVGIEELEGELAVELRTLAALGAVGLAAIGTLQVDLLSAEENGAALLAMAVVHAQRAALAGVAGLTAGDVDALLRVTAEEVAPAVAVPVVHAGVGVDTDAVFADLAVAAVGVLLALRALFDAVTRVGVAEEAVVAVVVARASIDALAGANVADLAVAAIVVVVAAGHAPRLAATVPVDDAAAEVEVAEVTRSAILVGLAGEEADVAFPLVGALPTRAEMVGVAAIVGRRAALGAGAVHADLTGAAVGVLLATRLLVFVTAADERHRRECHRSECKNEPAEPFHRRLPCPAPARAHGAVYITRTKIFKYWDFPEAPLAVHRRRRSAEIHPPLGSSPPHLRRAIPVRRRASAFPHRRRPRSGAATHRATT